MEENKKYSVEELLDRLNSAPDTTSNSSTFDILQRRNGIRGGTTPTTPRGGVQPMQTTPQRPTRQSAIKPDTTRQQPRQATSPMDLIQKRNMSQQRQMLQQNAMQQGSVNAQHTQSMQYTPQQPITTAQPRVPIRPKPTVQRQAPPNIDALENISGTNTSLDDIDNVQDYFNNRAIKLTRSGRVRQPNIQRRVIARNESFTYLEDNLQTRVPQGGETMAERSARLEDFSQIQQPMQTTQHQAQQISDSNVDDTETITINSKLKRPRRLYVSSRDKKMSADELYSDSAMSADVGTAEDTDQKVSAMYRSVTMKLISSIVCTGILLYAAVSQVISMPIPKFLVNRFDLLAYIMLGVFIIQAIINSSTISGGLISLFTLRPDNDIYSAVAVFAATMQGAYIAFKPNLLMQYSSSMLIPIASLLLVFNNVGKLSFAKRILNTFDIVAKNGEKNYIGITTDTSITEISMDKIAIGYPCVAYVKGADGIDYFEDECFSDSLVEMLSRYLGPAMAVVSCVAGIVYYIINKDVFTAITAFSSVAVVMAPLSAVLAAQLPLSKLNSKLAKSGSAISGYMAVDRMSEVNTMLLTSDQLFPSQNIALLDIKALQGVPLGKVVSDIACCLSPFKNNFTKMFKELGVNSSVKVDDPQYHDSQGYIGWIQGKRVQIGTRAFMESYNISLPHVNLEKDFNNNNREVLYVANSGVATGLIILSHTPNRFMQSALNVLCDNDFALLVMSNDPTLTPEKIGALYKYPPELITIIPDGTKTVFKERVLPTKIAGSTMAFENTSDAVSSIFLSKECRLFSRILAGIVIASIVIGFAFVITFVLLKQILTLSWLTIVAYHAVWLIIVLSVVAIWRINRN